MCEICGIVNIGASRPIDRDVLLRMTQLLEHRGKNLVLIVCNI